MNYNALCIYYAAINVVTFAAFAIDKIKAIMGAWRIRESVLLGLCALGGGVGGLLGMYVCHHKVRNRTFTTAVPALIFVHVALVAVIALAGTV